MAAPAGTVLPGVRRISFSTHVQTHSVPQVSPFTSAARSHTRWADYTPTGTSSLMGFENMFDYSSQPGVAMGGCAGTPTMGTPTMAVSGNPSMVHPAWPAAPSSGFQQHTYTDLDQVPSEVEAGMHMGGADAGRHLLAAFFEERANSSPSTSAQLQAIKVKNTFIDGFVDGEEEPDADTNGSTLGSKSCPLSALRGRELRRESKEKSAASAAAAAGMQLYTSTPPSMAPQQQYQQQYVQQLQPIAQQAQQPYYYQQQSSPYQAAMQVPMAHHMPAQVHTPPPQVSVQMGQHMPAQMQASTQVGVQQDQQQQMMVMMMPMQQAPQSVRMPQAPTVAPSQVPVVQQTLSTPPPPQGVPSMPTRIQPLGVRRPEPSNGSALHDGTGRCRPCAWFWKPQGCSNGQGCCHCHMCPEGELKARKKSKVALLRDPGTHQ